MLFFNINCFEHSVQPDTVPAKTAHQPTTCCTEMSGFGSAVEKVRLIVMGINN